MKSLALCKRLGLLHSPFTPGQAVLSFLCQPWTSPRCVSTTPGLTLPDLYCLHLLLLLVIMCHIDITFLLH